MDLTIIEDQDHLMGTVFLRFYEELNDFLPEAMQKQWIEREFKEGTTLKAVIEELGIPHTEVDLVLVNSDSEEFSYRLKPGDRVSIYPVFESLDIRGFSRVRPVPLRQVMFVLDVHLGKLTKYLRILGFDSLYSNDYTDDEIALISKRDHRAILTRDRGLLKRKIITHGYCIRSKDPDSQLKEVISRFDLMHAFHPFTLCLVCNRVLITVEKAAVSGIVPERVAKYYSEFKKCPSCNKIYWKGSHWVSMEKRLKKLHFNRSKWDSHLHD
ncbi:MAG: Mut7-C ubiquitin/RNAse domain-containing protein [Spirochaetales bacterium]|nr:Mut7-C ubiquitin/RNAse domain-containing protein [Spirochaetales bacterium]